MRLLLPLVGPALPEAPFCAFSFPLGDNLASVGADLVVGVVSDNRAGGTGGGVGDSGVVVGVIGIRRGSNGRGGVLDSWGAVVVVVDCCCRGMVPTKSDELGCCLLGITTPVVGAKCGNGISGGWVSAGFQGADQWPVPAWKKGDGTGLHIVRR